MVCADFVPWGLERCEKEQRAAGSSKLKFRHQYSANDRPPFASRITKSNKVLTYSHLLPSRQEEERGLEEEEEEER